jgi:hypothetical protein
MSGNSHQRRVAFRRRIRDPQWWHQEAEEVRAMYARVAAKAQEDLLRVIAEYDRRRDP